MHVENLETKILHASKQRSMIVYIYNIGTIAL